jgi:hypothetical protein
MSEKMTTYFTTSWDDGHPLDRKLGELLLRHGMAGTFYCPLKNAEGLPVMQAAELAALERDGAGAIELGSHTLEHAYADRMPEEQWQRQVLQGKAALEAALGHAVAGFCYPGGRLARHSRTTVQGAGFAYARTTENLRFDCGADPLLVPTSLQFYPHNRRVLVRNYVRRGHWVQRLQCAQAALSETQLERRLDRAFQSCNSVGGVFHLWGHSWEIESLGLWGLLDNFLARVAELVPRPQRLTNAGVLRAVGLLGKNLTSASP